MRFRRYRDYTMKLFEKHGMTNIGYFTPLDESEKKLYYVLAYPNRESRKKSWSSFMVDPEWLTVMSSSEKNGKLLTNIESTFLHLTDYSPQLKASADGGLRIFELRRYTCTAGNLTRLHDRFRDHTMNLFVKHGMTNVVYWALDSDQPAANDTLVYLLTHKSKDARDASFEAFRQIRRGSPQKPPQRRLRRPTYNTGRGEVCVIDANRLFATEIGRLPDLEGHGISQELG